MNILFVSSGNTGKIGVVVDLQAESIRKLGFKVDHYLINGKGLFGYLRNIYLLRSQLRSVKYDIVHAHYSFSGFLASLSMAYPLVVSFMGSDVKSGFFFRLLIRFFIFTFRWKYFIVKSQELATLIGRKGIFIIPNGVDIEKFTPMSKNECINKLNWNPDKRHLLFASNPNRPEKNFPLLLEAYRLIGNDQIELHVLDNIPPGYIPLYYNAADVVVLSSKWEGSPNVIKEAMACNRPIVSTAVGDVEWLFGTEPGHFLADFNSEAFSVQLLKALTFSEVNTFTKGRNRIIELSLSSTEVADKVISIYNIIKMKNS